MRLSHGCDSSDEKENDFLRVPPFGSDFLQSNGTPRNRCSLRLQPI